MAIPPKVSPKILSCELSDCCKCYTLLQGNAGACSGASANHFIECGVARRHHECADGTHTKGIGQHQPISELIDAQGESQHCAGQSRQGMKYNQERAAIRPFGNNAAYKDEDNGRKGQGPFEPRPKVLLTHRVHSSGGKEKTTI